MCRKKKLAMLEITPCNWPQNILLERTETPLEKHLDKNYFLMTPLSLPGLCDGSGYRAH